MAIALWLIGAGLAVAQDAGQGGPEDWARLQVDVDLARYRGEERVANLPYSLRLSDGGRQSQLRAGVDVPVRVNAENEIQYKNVGTSIDCSATATGDGDYLMWVSAEHSLVVPSAEAEAPFEGAPMFSSFHVSSWAEMSDGDSVELVSSTDPVTGEVMRIQVTLRVN